MRVYIAGPMTGLPQFNFPAFYEAARVLRKQGFDVVSPAELDAAEDAAAALASPTGHMSTVKKSWGDFLARDVKLLADGVFDSEFGMYKPIQGIVFLPGWQNSRGARLEAFVGLSLGFKFALYSPEFKTVRNVPQEYVQTELVSSWAGAIGVYDADFASSED